jgi:hypothetical protein
MPDDVTIERIETPLFKVIRGSVQLHHLTQAGWGGKLESDAVEREISDSLKNLTAAEWELWRVVAFALTRVPLWIPVSERLPDNRRTVLVALSSRSINYRSVGTGHWQNDGRGWFVTAGFDVTHWAEPPALPERPESIMGFPIKVVEGFAPPGGFVLGPPLGGK